MAKKSEHNKNQKAHFCILGYPITKQTLFSLLFGISIFVAVFTLIVATDTESHNAFVINRSFWVDFAFGYLVLLTFLYLYSNYEEKDGLKRENARLKIALQKQKNSLERELKMSFNSEDDFKLFLESEIATLRNILSDYEDDQTKE